LAYYPILSLFWENKRSIEISLVLLCVRESPLLAYECLSQSLRNLVCVWW
jgi:hypothetical protein